MSLFFPSAYYTFNHQMWSVLCLSVSQGIYSHQPSPTVVQDASSCSTQIWWCYYPHYWKLFRGFPPHSPLWSSPETFPDPKALQDPTCASLPASSLILPLALSSTLTGLPQVHHTWPTPPRWPQPPNKLFPLPGPLFPRVTSTDLSKLSLTTIATWNFM